MSNEIEATELTARDVLKLIGDKAQWCREEGEADMRYITHMAEHIGGMMDDGKTRKEIIAKYSEEPPFNGRRSR